MKKKIEIAFNVPRVYIGAANTCCCGCAGDYYDRKHNSAKEFQRAVAKVQSAMNKASYINIGTNHVRATVGSKLFIVYFEIGASGLYNEWVGETK